MDWGYGMMGVYGLFWFVVVSFVFSLIFWYSRRLVEGEKRKKR
jgi:uncharacterized membrane protein